jgi:transposase, IS5 family
MQYPAMSNMLIKAVGIARRVQKLLQRKNIKAANDMPDINMPDAESLKPMIRGHLNLFQTPIESGGMDKGYYSKDNEQFMLDVGVKNVALQRPHRSLRDPPNNPINEERLTELINRRARIEPIIGHLKRRWQMGKSRMKSDQTTEASGFAAMLGFNLHQLMRNLNGEVKPKAA